MRPFLPSLVMTLLGIITGAVLLTLLILFERYTAGMGTIVRVHGYLFFFIIPVPAILLSWFACTGFYLGARITHYRPGNVVLLNILLFCAFLFFATYWLEFTFVLRPYGFIPADMGFGEFFYRTIFESDISLTKKSGLGGRTIDSSWVSAGSSLLIFGGYLFGGFAVYEWIRILPYCEKCGQFMEIRGKQVRYPPDKTLSETMIDSMQNLAKEFDARELEKVFVRHAGETRARRLKKRYWRSILWHKECIMCGADCLEYQAYRMGRGGWTEVGDKLQVYIPHGIRLDP